MVSASGPRCAQQEGREEKDENRLQNEVVVYKDSVEGPRKGRGGEGTSWSSIRSSGGSGVSLALALALANTGSCMDGPGLCTAYLTLRPHQPRAFMCGQQQNNNQIQMNGCPLKEYLFMDPPE